MPTATAAKNGKKKTKKRPTIKPPAQTIETVEIKTLKPHERNYRDHPDDQVDHIISSIKKNGVYRNIVVAKEYTILAGHGVVKALKKLKMKKAPVIRLNISPDSPQALKILTGDNEIGHLGLIDDRLLTELLKEIKEVDPDGLIGTGFDEMMLANIAMVTRNSSEIRNFEEAAEWLGMPEYDAGEKEFRLTIKFMSMEDRRRFIKEHPDVIVNTRHGDSMYDAITPGVAKKMVEKKKQSDKCPYCKSKLRRELPREPGDKRYAPICPKHGSVEREDCQNWGAWWPFRGENDLLSLQFQEEKKSKKKGKKK